MPSTQLWTPNNVIIPSLATSYILFPPYKSNLKLVIVCGIHLHAHLPQINYFSLQVIVHFNTHITETHMTTHRCPESYFQYKDTSFNEATVTAAITKHCYSCMKIINLTENTTLQTYDGKHSCIQLTFSKCNITLILEKENCDYKTASLEK